MYKLWKIDCLLMISFLFFALTLWLFTTEAIIKGRISIKGFGCVERSKNPKSYWVVVLLFAVFSGFFTFMIVKLLMKG